MSHLLRIGNIFEFFDSVKCSDFIAKLVGALKFILF